MPRIEEITPRKIEILRARAHYFISPFFSALNVTAEPKQTNKRSYVEPTYTTIEQTTTIQIA